ncbi:hypothetical protein BLIN101_03355 [Brevibacterium linens]|uniref:Uncharacterized protein n=1 Tax=Brevibacterium linens TaxID=1703 RepID=A0A2H1KHA4_BRELN|nr:hypothetical protein BLIN101_03355 [Brevibacterium linens]
MIRAFLGHRGALRMIRSVTDRARISAVTSVAPLGHRVASKSARSGHRSARLGARHCKGIVMPFWCPADVLLVPAQYTSETEEVTP